MDKLTVRRTSAGRSAVRTLSISITIQCTACRFQWFDSYSVRPGQPMPAVPTVCPYCGGGVSS